MAPQKMMRLGSQMDRVQTQSQRLACQMMLLDPLLVFSEIQVPYLQSKDANISF